MLSQLIVSNLIRALENFAIEKFIPAIDQAYQHEFPSFQDFVALLNQNVLIINDEFLSFAKSRGYTKYLDACFKLYSPPALYSGRSKYTPTTRWLVD